MVRRNARSTFSAIVLKMTQVALGHKKIREQECPFINDRLYFVEKHGILVAQ
jgi:hypothetical protein